MSSEKMTAFSSSTEYLDWTNRNCRQCAKGFIQYTDTMPCELEMALDPITGEMPVWIAKRIGCGENPYYLFSQCKEYQPKGERHE
jgi:hypothetical protein